MGKNKLAKFAEMETFPHVLQYPFARLQQEAFPLRGRSREDFFTTTAPSCWSSAVVRASTP